MLQPLEKAIFRSRSDIRLVFPCAANITVTLSLQNIEEGRRTLAGGPPRLGPEQQKGRTADSPPLHRAGGVVMER